MIVVCEDNLSLKLFQIVLSEGFNGGGSADWHKHRCLDGAMRSN